MKVLAFDIGIKHLAWCLYDISGSQILGWSVENLLEPDGAPAVQAQKQCCKCKAPARFTCGTSVTCKRHATLPPLEAKKDLASLLDALKAKAPAAKVKRSKAAVLEALAAHCAIPIEKPKTKSAMHATDGAGIHTIHDSIRSLVSERHELFFQADKVLLENQPAYKNPTMKTVQILLYAELRSAFIDNGYEAASIGFVHAGKKNKGGGQEKGDAGYADRKKETKERVESWLAADAGRASWQTFYKSHKKRDDLADAWCMSYDCVISP